MTDQIHGDLVCSLRAELEKARTDRTQLAIDLERVVEEHNKLVVQCAAMRQALSYAAMFIKRIYVGAKVPNAIEAQDAREFCMSALTNDCGKAFLERMREAEVILENLVGAPLPINEEWYERRDAFLKNSQ